MENGVSDIPIYKIYHIRSPDVTKPKPVDDLEGAAAESELSPEYNVIYVFYGDVEFMADEGRVVDIMTNFFNSLIIHTFKEYLVIMNYY